MPSPFPGMDPYLEDPDIFPDIHNGFIIFLQAELQPRLPPPYYAVTGARVWYEDSRRYLEPDVELLQPRGTTGGKNGGTLAVLPDTDARPIIIEVPEDERRETFIEIRTRREDRSERLVTSIEVLSPSNKTPGEHGRELYLRKQREIHESDTNLVEIDLLRGGQHTTAIPRPRAVAEAGPFDYHVCAQRFDCHWRYHVYPIRLAEVLPKVAIPLLPGDPYVTVDLQAVFTRAYDAGPYQRRIRYGHDPITPRLTPEQMEWATNLLRQRGLPPA